jgi:hypothetical protein
MFLGILLSHSLEDFLNIQLQPPKELVWVAQICQMNKVSGAVPTLTANTNVHLLNNRTAEYVIINGSMTENENGFTQEELKYL